jgi:HAD superfamily phosphoserine phosphatase-like hydrolase
MNTRKIAIFDIDGVVFRWSLFLDLVHQLIANGTYPKDAAKEFEHEYEAWLNRHGEYNAYLKKVLQTHYKYLKGCREKDLHRAAHQVITVKKDRMSVFSRKLISTLKAKNYYLVANSGSPSFIVEEYAKHLGFDIGIGNTYHVENGVFVGTSSYGVDPHIDKSSQIKKHLSVLPFKINYAKSIAVGDTKSDVAILKMVGQPIAFNPDALLLKTARRNGWRVVIERKDVIYDLKSFSIVK